MESVFLRCVLLQIQIEHLVLCHMAKFCSSGLQGVNFISLKSLKIYLQGIWPWKVMENVKFHPGDFPAESFISKGWPSGHNPEHPNDMTEQPNKVNLKSLTDNVCSFGQSFLRNFESQKKHKCSDSLTCKAVMKTGYHLGWYVDRTTPFSNDI